MLLLGHAQQHIVLSSNNRFAHLGAGPASSVSLVILATLLLASTRASFGSDGVDPEEDILVVGVK